VRTGRVDGLVSRTGPDACLALAVHDFRETKSKQTPFYGVWCKIGENKRNRTLVNSLVPPLSHVMLHVLLLKFRSPCSILALGRSSSRATRGPERVRIRTGRAGNVGERAGDGGRGLQSESGVGPVQHQLIVRPLKIKERGSKIFDWDVRKLRKLRLHNFMNLYQRTGAFLHQGTVELPSRA